MATFGTKNPQYLDRASGFLVYLSKSIAFLLCVILIGASLMITYSALKALIAYNAILAFQEGMFVLILLEMMYVIFSFIKYGSINVSLVINVGLIAIIKEIVLTFERLTLHSAIGFGVLILTLSLAYVVEMIVYERKKS